MRRFITSESLSLFASTPSKKAYSTFDGNGEVNWLSRVQSANFDISLNREVMKDIGSEDFFIQRINLENYTPPANPGEPSVISPNTTNSPTDENLEPLVSLDFSYYLTDGKNEKYMGLAVNKIGCKTQTPFCSNLLKDQNFFLATHKDNGSDLNIIDSQAELEDFDIIGFGNCYITNYSLSASVGSFPLVSTQWVASNVEINKYVDPNNQGDISFRGIASADVAASEDLEVKLVDKSTAGTTVEYTEVVSGVFVAGADASTMALNLAGQTPIQVNDANIVVLTAHTTSPSTVATTVAADWEIVSVKAANQPENPGVASVFLVPANLVPAINSDELNDLGALNPGGYEYELPLHSDHHEPEIAAIRPADILLEIPNLDLGGIKLERNDVLPVNSFDIDIEIAREDLYGMGSIYVFDRKLNFPLRGNINLSFHADEFESGSLSSVFKKDHPYELHMSVKNSCEHNFGAETPDRIKLKISNAIFLSENYTTAIGSTGLLTLSFYFSVTSEGGFFMSGEENSRTQLLLLPPTNPPAELKSNYDYTIDQNLTAIENWINSSPLQLHHEGATESLTSIYLDSKIQNSSNEDVGVIEYYLLDDPINFDGGCLEVSEINGITASNKKSLTETDPSGSEYIDLNDTLNFCPTKQLIVLFKYDHNGVASSNFKVINFVNENPPELSSLEFKTVDIFGHNEGPFSLDDFISNIVVTDEIGGEVSATFILEEDNVPRQEITVENININNSDLSPFSLPPLYVGKYKLYLKSLKDCSGQTVFSFNETKTTETVFEVVKFNIKYPDIAPKLNVQSVAYTVPKAEINYVNSRGKTVVYLSDLNPSSVDEIDSNGNSIQSISLSSNNSYAIPRTIAACASPQRYEVSWAPSENNKFDFTEDFILEVEDLSPPVLRNIEYGSEVLYHFNTTNLKLAHFITNINLADNCTSASNIKQYYIRAWGHNFRYKEFILIDSNGPNDGSAIDDPKGNFFIKYKTWNSLSDALLSVGLYYDCLDPESPSAKTFQNTQLDSGVHKVKLEHLEDQAGNLSTLKEFGFFRVLTLRSISDFKTVHIEAGSDQAHKIKQFFQAGIYGSGDALFQSFSLPIASITPNARPEFSNFNKDILVSSDLLDPSQNEEIIVLYDSASITSSIDPSNPLDLDYKIRIQDTQSPRVNSSAIALRNQILMGGAINLNDFDINVDAYDLGSKYQISFDFELRSPNGGITPVSVSNTNTSGITIPNATLSNSAVAGLYTLTLKSVEDLQGNDTTINHSLQFAVKTNVGLSIEATASTQTIAWAPEYGQSEIVFCYDGSGSMTVAAGKEIIVETDLFYKQRTWIHKTIDQLKELEESGIAAPGTFKVSLVQFSTDAKVDKSLSFLTDEEISVGDFYDAGTKFDPGLNLSGKQFTNDTSKYKMILFTSDGGSSSAGFVETTPGISDVAKKLYEVNANDLLPLEERIRIRTVPVKIANASEASLKSVGRGGQGLTSDKEPTMLSWDGNLDNGDIPQDLFFQTLQAIAPQNGFAFYTISNNSNSHLYLNDLDEDFVKFSFAGDKIQKVVPFGKTMRTSSEEYYYLEPGGSVELYYNIIPTQKAISDVENDEAVDLDAEFNLQHFAYFNRQLNLADSDDLSELEFSLGTPTDSLFNINIGGNIYSADQDFQVATSVKIQKNND